MELKHLTKPLTLSQLKNEQSYLVSDVLRDGSLFNRNKREYHTINGYVLGKDGKMTNEEFLEEINYFINSPDKYVTRYSNTMKGHKTTCHKDCVTKLENSVRKMF